MNTKPYNKADYTVKSYDTFPEFLIGIAGEYGQRNALSWFDRRKEEHTLTYAQLTGKVEALRNSLLHTGLTPGSHVAIVGENSADWIISFLAVVCCGCVAVCVDTEQSDESIRDMVRHSDAKQVFLSPTFLPIVLPLLNEGEVSRLVVMGTNAEDERAEAIERLYEQGVCLSEQPCPAVSPDQTAQIVFTSGTTSRSKMVMLSHKAVMQNCSDSTQYVRFFDRTYTSLPFYHAYGLNCAVINSFLRGSHLYINGNLKTAVRDLQLAKPDTMLTVPLMMEAIHNQIWLEAERAGKAEGLRTLVRVASVCRKLHLPIRFKTFDQLREKISGTLHLIICGGARLNPEIAEEFELMGIQTLQGYGITECSPLISVNCNYANKLGSVGLPMPTMELRIEEEEICVRGPSIMQGYYNDPEQTEQALSEGWFRTGDIGYLDKDGFLYITGRKKNLIVFKNGKKISPEKLEEQIATIPMVKEVLVTGTSSGTFADDVKLIASIYPDPDRTGSMSSYEILEHLQREVDRINRELPSYQQIRMVNIREKEFNKTGTKKIKRYDN